MLFRKTPLSLAVAIAVIGFSNVIHAQPVAEEREEAAVLDAVTVTAQQGATKLQAPVIETPQAVTVIDRAQIQEQGAMSVQRATAYTAGVFSNQIGASNRFDYLVLRGFSDGSLGNTYLNGLKILGDTNSHSSLVVDPWFLDSIEVVRGPSSVLYGQSSPGGIVALQTRKPQFRSSREIEIGVGNRNEAYAAFDINEAVSERLAVRLAGKVRKTDTQVNQVKEERYALMPSLSWLIDADTTLDLMAYLHRDPEGGYHSGLPYEGTVVARNGRFISRNFYEGESDYEQYKRKQNMLGYALEHRFNDTVSFRQSLQHLKSDVTLKQVYGYGWASATDLTRYYAGSEEDLSALTVDNQFTFRFSSGPISHTLLTGLDYQSRKNTVSWPSGLFPTINAFNPVYGAVPTTMYAATREQHDLKQTGVYVQDLLSWDRWRLTLGGRVDKVDISSTTLSTGSVSQIKDDQWSGRVGLLYHFDSGYAPYVNYSTSFTPTNFVDAQGNLLKPMEGRQLEAGIKYQAPGSRNVYSLALFDITQKNVATKEQPNDPYRAVGEIESKGVELEANTWLNRQVNLRSSYTYNDIRYSRSDDGNQGNRAVYAPKHLANLWVSYAHEGALKGLSTAFGARYAAGIVADRANTYTLPSYTLFDLALTYDLRELGFKGVTTRLGIQNLMDRTYVAACNSLEYCYFGAERKITASLNYQF